MPNYITILPNSPSFALSLALEDLRLTPQNIPMWSTADNNSLMKIQSPNKFSPCFKIAKRLLQKKIYLQLVALFFGMTCSAQTISTYAVNSAGNQISSGKYNYEWSVGESTIITTMNNSNLMFTNGFLQYNVQNQPASNLVPTFLPDEIKVGPNPTINMVEINILHAEKGKIQIELMDNRGNKIKVTQLDYVGLGAFEKWNLGGLPAGQYLINIRQTHAVNGRLIKNGAYQIVKVN
jgi:hypothetical protein